MTTDISDFVPRSLVEMDICIEVADGNFVTVKQTGEAQINTRNYNVKPFIGVVYNVLFIPDLCDRVFFIITLMNSGRDFLFHNGFCTFFFSSNE